MQKIIKDLISKDPAKRPDTIKNLAIIKETILTTNEIESTKSNTIRRLNGSPYFKLPVLIGGLGTLIILIIGFYFIPIRGVEEKTVSLSALEKEKNTEDTNNVIVVPKSTSITTPTNLPTPDISPTPSLNIDLDDKKIVGNLIYDFSAYMGWGYIEFLLFSDNIKNRDTDLSYMFYEREGIGPTLDSRDSLTPERWNQVRNLITESVSIDVDSGAGFSKWENQSVSCNVYRDCEISLLGFKDQFMKTYDRKQVVRIKYNVSKQDLFRDVDLYSTNGSIDVLTFEPATCLTIYNKMINPPKDFENMEEIDKEYRTNLYNLLRKIDGC
jgi:hypothetical protein